MIDANEKAWGESVMPTGPRRSTPESCGNDGANGHRFSIVTRGRDNVSWNSSRCATHHSNPPKASRKTFLSGICLELTHLAVGLVRRPAASDWSSRVGGTAARWRHEYEVESHPIHGTHLGFNAQIYLAVGGSIRHA
jgi:hypothetical protein